MVIGGGRPYESRETRGRMREGDTWKHRTVPSRRHALRAHMCVHEWREHRWRHPLTIGTRLRLASNNARATQRNVKAGSRPRAVSTTGATHARPLGVATPTATCKTPAEGRGVFAAGQIRHQTARDQRTTKSSRQAGPNAPCGPRQASKRPPSRVPCAAWLELASCVDYFTWYLYRDTSTESAGRSRPPCPWPAPCRPTASCPSCRPPSALRSAS